MIVSLPLDTLCPSPRNVRQSADAAADLQLKADIAGRGLIQNLVVSKAKKPKGRYHVEAGNRRLAALQALAAEGAIAPDTGVPCLVVESDPVAMREAGLAENFQRLSMTAADECRAFGQLIADGADVEGVARRFGLTVRFVEGRLRLSDLASPVFDALSRGAITLDVAKAYAVSADRERQAYVYEQLANGYGATSPDTIRRMMTEASIRAGDRRALFVGEDAYVAAGGRIERDLFADETEARWLDIALVDRLAGEKLAALADAAASEQELAFVRPILDPWVNGDHVAGLQRIDVAPMPLTDAEVQRIDALEAEIADQIAILEDERSSESELVKAEAAVQDASQALRAITDRPPVLDPELQSQAGTFLLIDETGTAALHRSYFRIAPSSADEAEEGNDRVSDTVDAAPGRGLSQRLIDELTMQRRDILAVHIAADPALALDLAIFLAVVKAETRTLEQTGFALRAGPVADPIGDFATPDAAASIARSQAADGLDRSWLAGDTLAERFDAFRRLDEPARGAWLGHAVASTLDASLGGTAHRCAFHDHLGGLLGIDVAAWWRPTGANYFDRVPKAVALSALAAVGGDELARRYDKAKKAELAQSCERIFAGDFIADVAVKEAALAWLPDAMRFQPPAHLVEILDESDLADGPDGETGDGPARRPAGEIASGGSCDGAPECEAA
ncbi:ParB/RepB/Spo0J family partition protein [Allosphingosinicella indica]|uniref:ParB family protein n=1 Tax=Allosphingosinicella indica TaxID=941907 RepID=A0A1X7G006_9SPHN|nr:ParB/RepB/Spo0J family partition protein [Allosphingosinicella indica]SMF61183.1 ParB family protein [Allosphingosinicella indica]